MTVIASAADLTAAYYRLRPDPDELSAVLSLTGPAGIADLTDAITADPTFEQTIDGATTLSIDVDDHTGRFLDSGLFTEKCFTVIDGTHLSLAKVSFSGDTISLELEDAIVAALREKPCPGYAADTLTRQAMAADMARRAGVRIQVDPARRELVHKSVEKPKDTADGTTSKAPKTPADCWTVLGQLASDVGWRCFSDGQSLYFGSDAWLTSRVPATPMRRRTGGVQDIDFEFDIRAKDASATATIDVSGADRWSLPPGLPVDISGLGPANGRWLINKLTRGLLGPRGTLELLRAQPSLAEPPSDDAGEDFLPSDGDTSTSLLRDEIGPSGSENSASTPVDRMLRWARAGIGKPYVWGGSGPDGYDCSGFVQGASGAGGLRLTKPARNQLDLCQRGAARMVTVADAVRTPGALLFRVGIPGVQDHVAISLGDGRTVEARGKAYGCCVVTNAARRQWNQGAIINWSSKVRTVSSSGPR